MEKNLKDLIYVVNDRQVMLVGDIAKIYQIEVKRINEIIKRNKDIFSNKEYFQLSKEEYDLIISNSLRFQDKESLRSQIVILNEKNEPLRSQIATLNEENEPLRSQIVTLNETKNSRGNHIKYLPFVLTHDGIEKLSTLIKKEKKYEITKKILDTFEAKNKQQIIPQSLVLKEENITPIIYTIRGKQVMLDSDLAKLYQCKNGTKTLNLAVKRNIERFPERFMFQLTKEEVSRFQFETLNENKQGSNIKYLPFVFTEQGVAMLSSILKTENAAKVSIAIMDAFVAMRHFISDNQDIYVSLNNINNKLIEHDEKINLLFEKFDKNELKEKVFYENEFYDAYSKIVDLMKKTKKELIIVDSYADKTVLDIISNIKTKTTIITKEKNLLKKIDIEKYQKQYHNLEVIYSKIFHDRFIIIDEDIIYHLGTSLNHMGSKIFVINKLEDEDIKKTLLNKIKSITKKDFI